MLDLGLSTSDQKKFEATLVKSHKVDIKVHVMNFNHEVTSDITNQMIDGQITLVQRTSKCQRSLTMTILDPHATMGIDTGDGSDGTLFLDRMIRVYYEVYVPDLTRAKKWIVVPVFTGPISSADRQGLTIAIEATSKETLAGPAWIPYTVKARTNKVTAIKDILVRAGEAYYGDLGKTSGKLSKNLIVARDAESWATAKNIAQSLDRDLYYDAWGHACMRKKPMKSLYTFRTGENGNILSAVDMTVDPEDLSNVVMVTGATPTKGKAPTYTAQAPSAHPLSPWNLGRVVYGKTRPRYIPQVVQSDHYRTVAACKTRAKSLLKARLDNSVHVKFDSLPIPHLEPNDLVTIITDKMNMEFRFTSVTLPLNGEGKMTVGYIRNQLINKRAIRNRVVK